MKFGRISYNMEQRSVRKFMKSESGSLLSGFLQYKDCAQSGKLTAASRSCPIHSKKEIDLLFYRVYNQCICQGAEPGLLTVTVLMPSVRQEQELIVLVKELSLLCQKEGVLFGQTFSSVSNGVKEMIVSLSLAAYRENELSEPQGFEGSALYALGHSGMAGASILADQRRAELSARYSGMFLDGAAAFFRDLSVKPFADALKTEDGRTDEDFWTFPVSEGGVFAGLWYLADGLKSGLEIDMKKIPIRQETVEICEYFRINPYLLSGDGMLLLAAKDEKKLVRRLTEADITFSKLGVLKGNARVIRNEEEVRYLDKPAADELWMFLTDLQEK